MTARPQHRHDTGGMHVPLEQLRTGDRIITNRDDVVVRAVKLDKAGMPLLQLSDELWGGHGLHTVASGVPGWFRLADVDLGVLRPEYEYPVYIRHRCCFPL